MVDANQKEGGQREACVCSSPFVVYGTVLFFPIALLLVLQSVPLWPVSALTTPIALALFFVGHFLWILAAFLALAALFVVPLFLVAAIARAVYERRNPDSPKQAARMLIIALLFAGVSCAHLVQSASWNRMQLHAITHVPAQLQPLLDGLEIYKETNGSYPVQLDALVPDVLDGLPNTGYPVYSRYTYRPPPAEDPDAHFHIYIRPPMKGLEYPPGIAYCPDENHPRDAHHYLSKTRVGDWVYSPYEYSEVSDRKGGARAWFDSMRIRE